MAVVINGTTGIDTIQDDVVGLAQMASGTDGNLITYDASGNPAAVAVGTSGQVLTSNGAGAAPTMQAGGKLIGYQYSTDTTNRSGTAGSEVATGLTFSYTPSATSSRLLISMFVPCTTFDASTSAVRVKWRVRTGTGTGGTELTASSFGDYENEVNVAQFDAAQTFTFIHHPNTTSAQSYNLTVEDLSGTATWKCSGIDNTGVTTISILEIEG